MMLRLVSIDSFSSAPKDGQTQDNNNKYHFYNIKGLSYIQVLNVRLNTPNLKTLKLKSNQTEKIMTIRGCPNL